MRGPDLKKSIFLSFSLWPKNLKLKISSFRDKNEFYYEKRDKLIYRLLFIRIHSVHYKIVISILNFVYGFDDPRNFWEDFRCSGCEVTFCKAWNGPALCHFQYPTDKRKTRKLVIRQNEFMWNNLHIIKQYKNFSHKFVSSIFFGFSNKTNRICLFQFFSINKYFDFVGVSLKIVKFWKFRFYYMIFWKVAPRIFMAPLWLSIKRSRKFEKIYQT